MKKTEKPLVDEIYTCVGCDLKIRIVRSCSCAGEGPTLTCCGHDLARTRETENTRVSAR